MASEAEVQQAEEAPPQEVKPSILVITWDRKAGALNVNGPLQDRLLCYGMLEMAKEVIAKHNEQVQLRRMVDEIVPVKAMPRGLK